MVWFKYSSKDNIWPSKAQMAGFISSDYKTFNDDNFLNFFLVDKKQFILKRSLIRLPLIMK